MALVHASALGFSPVCVDTGNVGGRVMFSPNDLRGLFQPLSHGPETQGWCMAWEELGSAAPLFTPWLKQPWLTSYVAVVYFISDSSFYL